ncbi:hypothetical protein BC826DRAFT_974285 [Russula brevipes]|nr:hypothetical protein BC826DRAFT_974285 [Russula brevipes]
MAQNNNNNNTSASSTPPPNQESLLQNLWDETAPAKDLTSMVEWLAPTFNNHQKRLFGAVRASHQSFLYLQRIRENHEAGKFPDFIQSLEAPKALDGLPSLQALWDEVHSQYKESLYQALVNSRQEKLDLQYSPAIQEEIIKSLVADTKKLIADKSALDPGHLATFHNEGKATFTLFTSSIPSWVDEAKEQAVSSFQKQRAQKEANESRTLDQANTTRPTTSAHPQGGHREGIIPSTEAGAIQYREATSEATTEGPPGAEAHQQEEEEHIYKQSTRIYKL